MLTTRQSRPLMGGIGDMAGAALPHTTSAFTFARARCLWLGRQIATQSVDDGALVPLARSPVSLNPEKGKRGRSNQKEVIVAMHNSEDVTEPPHSLSGPPELVVLLLGVGIRAGSPMVGATGTSLGTSAYVCTPPPPPPPFG